MGQPTPTKAVEATREPSFLLAKPEKRLLTWIATRVPRYLLPDDFTALGVLAALAFALPINSQTAASAGCGSQARCWWCSGSATRSTARWRGSARSSVPPTATTSTISSTRSHRGDRDRAGPVAADAAVDRDVDRGCVPDPLDQRVPGELRFGRFSIGYGLIRPTEVRLILIALNTVVALGAGVDFVVADIELTVFDVIGLAIAAVMLTLLVGRAARNLRELAQREPAAPRG